MPHAVNTNTMGTLVRVLLLGVVVLMPGGLLLLPVLALSQIRQGKKPLGHDAPDGPIAAHL
jgi:hypothetical protein